MVVFCYHGNCWVSYDYLMQTICILTSAPFRKDYVRDVMPQLVGYCKAVRQKAFLVEGIQQSPLKIDRMEMLFIFDTQIASTREIQDGE